MPAGAAPNGMPVRWRAIGLALVMLAASASSAGAAVEPSQYVYRLVMTGCKDSAGRFVQSAFKPAGMPALITALHGIAGCASIDVFDAHGGPAFVGRRFKIGRTDVAHDVAEVIADPALSAADGLPVAPYPAVRRRTSVGLRIPRRANALTRHGRGRGNSCADAAAGVAVSIRHPQRARRTQESRCRSRVRRHRWGAHARPFRRAIIEHGQPGGCGRQRRIEPRDGSSNVGDAVGPHRLAGVRRGHGATSGPGAGITVRA